MGSALTRWNEQDKINLSPTTLSSSSLGKKYGLTLKGLCPGDHALFVCCCQNCIKIMTKNSSLWGLSTGIRSQ